ncbi:hypothetical protein PIB30_053641 [Stylosanthes scabra]|uniref:Uncharacterized protein n=1 Tax=Stylosanthes scabra TaxID=79078 RepID=A0ABU6WKK2_9FABA|nr:hypothetical protein [Stylosanthes scabra]
MADYGVLHRNEASGALSGLFRVRRFQQPAAGTPVPGKGVVTCKFPADPTVALGYLSFAFLIVSTVAGYMSLFYPYKGKSVPQGVLFKH